MADRTDPVTDYDKMPRFSSISTCPKCGSQEASSIFVKNHTFHNPEVDLSFIERECNRCGYVRREKPLDVAETKE